MENVKKMLMRFALSEDSLKDAIDVNIDADDGTFYFTFKDINKQLKIHRF